MSFHTDSERRRNTLRRAVYALSGASALFLVVVTACGGDEFREGSGRGGGSGEAGGGSGGGATGGTGNGGEGAAGTSGAGGEPGAGGTGIGGSSGAGGDGQGGAAGDTSGGDGGAAGSDNPPPCIPPLAEVFVAPEGRGEETGCDPENAVATIAEALSLVADEGAIRVAQGRYSNQHIVLNRPLVLRGGYNDDFTASDNDAFPTVLTGTEAETLRVSGTAMDTRVLIEGFIVQNASQAEAGFAIRLASGVPTVRNCLLAGSNAAGMRSGGLVVGSGAVATIEDSTALGGNAPRSYGLNLEFLSGSIVVDRTLAAGGTAASGISYGAYVEAPFFVVRNSVILGGSGQSSIGLHLAGSSARSVANNTIAGGPGTAASVAIDVSGPHRFTNNILFTLGSADRTCFREGSSGGAHPASFLGNLLFACPNALYVRDATLFDPPLTIEQINAFDGVLMASNGHSQFSGNLTTTMTPFELFTDPDGIDNVFATVADNDFSLKTNDLAIIEGGIDSTQMLCGTKEALVACDGSDRDYLQGQRSVGFSIGAHEKEP